MKKAAKSLHKVKKNLLAVTKISVFLLVLFQYPLKAQVNTEWVKVYNREGVVNDRPNSMTIDISGNIYIAGFSQDNIGNIDCCIIKYNSSGVLQWVQHYSPAGNGNDNLSDIAVDNSGNVYATGYSWVNNTAKYDCLTLKYNTNGVLQWTAGFNGPNLNDEGRSIALDKSGNVYVTGKSDTLAEYSGRFITIKYNSTGIQQWAVRYPGVPGSDNSAVSIAVDNSANIYITGYNSLNSNNPDYLTVKYNSSGAEQWAERYNGTGNSFDIPKCLMLDSQGNVFITGESSAANNSDCVTIKYNSSGTMQWNARYNGNAGNNDAGNSIAFDNSGNIFIAGRTIVNGADDMLLIKYSTNGTTQWVNTYNGSGSGFDEAGSVITDNSGNIYITGTTQSDSSGSTVFTTIRYNSDASQQWIMNYSGSSGSNNLSTCLQLDSFNNVIVTGSGNGAGTGYDIITLKYSNLSGINFVLGKIPASFSLMQNYPNPFNPATNIKLDIYERTHVKLCVYDILGMN